MINHSDLSNFHQHNRILLKASDFIYVYPHARLKPYISNYTITFPNTDIISDNYTIIPHGSSTLVFSFDGNRVKSDLFGATTKINIVGKQANDQVMLLIVEFQPWGLYRFIGINQWELTDKILPFETVNKQLQNSIIEIIEKSTNLDMLLLQLDLLFLSYIDSAFSSSYYDALLISADEIISKNGILSVKDLSRSVCYSERHLNRIFKQHIGISMKSFARILRVNQTIKILKKSDTTISHAAEIMQYYDTSHLTHDFKRICNVTPSEYLKNLSDFYNEISKF